MEEKHKLLYETLGYTGPLEPGSQPLSPVVIADELVNTVDANASPLIDEAYQERPPASCK